MIFAAVSRGVLFSLIFCLSRGHCRRYRLLLCRCPRLPDPFVASVLFFPPRDLSSDTFPSPSRRLRRLSRRHRWEQRPFRLVLLRFLRFSLLLLRGARLRFLCPSRRKSRRSVLLLFFVFLLQNRSRPSLFILVLFWSSLFSQVSRRGASSRRRQRLRFLLQFFRRFPRAFHGDLDVFSRRRRRSSFCFWDNSPSLTRPTLRSALQQSRRRLLTYS